MGGRVRSRRYGGFRRSGLNLLFRGFTSRFPWFYLAVFAVQKLWRSFSFGISKLFCQLMMILVMYES